jgi:uncharacterized protein
MGTMLAALLGLQSIERQLTDVRSRLKTRKNAVNSQQKRIDQMKGDWEALHTKAGTRKRDADRVELDLKSKEEQVTKLRAALNLAKTNKEYAALLTQINTHKADNAKFEEEVLRIMAEVDAINAEGEKIKKQLDDEGRRLEELQKNSQAEIDRLTVMMDELSARRAEAAKAVPPEALAVFEELASHNNGDAMAVIETVGKRPPFEYVCNGCYMSLNAEHANVLRSRDEIRLCDNCGRILYLETQETQQARC